MGKRMMVTATLAAKKTEEKLSVLAGMVSSNLEALANAYTTSYTTYGSGFRKNGSHK